MQLMLHNYVYWLEVYEYIYVVYINMYCVRVGTAPQESY
jgi:hypothetical protein